MSVCIAWGDANGVIRASTVDISGADPEVIADALLDPDGKRDDEAALDAAAAAIVMEIEEGS